MPKCLRVKRHSDRKRRLEEGEGDGESNPKRYCQQPSEESASSLQPPENNRHHHHLTPEEETGVTDHQFTHGHLPVVKNHLYQPQPSTVLHSQILTCRQNSRETSHAKEESVSSAGDNASLCDTPLPSHTWQRTLSCKSECRLLCSSHPEQPPHTDHSKRTVVDSSGHNAGHVPFPASLEGRHSGTTHHHHHHHSAGYGLERCVQCVKERKVDAVSCRQPLTPPTTPPLVGLKDISGRVQHKVRWREGDAAPHDEDTFQGSSQQERRHTEEETQPLLWGSHSAGIPCGKTPPGGYYFRDTRGETASDSLHWKSNSIDISTRDTRDGEQRQEATLHSSESRLPVSPYLAPSSPKDVLYGANYDRWTTDLSSRHKTPCTENTFLALPATDRYERTDEGTGIRRHDAVLYKPSPLRSHHPAEIHDRVGGQSPWTSQGTSHHDTRPPLEVSPTACPSQRHERVDEEGPRKKLDAAPQYKSQFLEHFPVESSSTQKRFGEEETGRRLVYTSNRGVHPFLEQGPSLGSPIDARGRMMEDARHPGSPGDVAEKLEQSSRGNSLQHRVAVPGVAVTCLITSQRIDGGPEGPASNVYTQPGTLPQPPTQGTDAFHSPTHVMSFPVGVTSLSSNVTPPLATPVTSLSTNNTTTLPISMKSLPDKSPTPLLPDSVMSVPSRSVMMTSPYQTSLTSLPTSVIKRSGPVQAQEQPGRETSAGDATATSLSQCVPYASNHQHHHPHPHPPPRGYITVTKDFIRLPRELLFPGNSPKEETGGRHISAEEHLPVSSSTCSRGDSSTDRADAHSRAHVAEDLSQVKQKAETKQEDALGGDVSVTVVVRNDAQTTNNTRTPSDPIAREQLGGDSRFQSRSELDVRNRQHPGYGLSSTTCFKRGGGGGMAVESNAIYCVSSAAPTLKTELPSASSSVSSFSSSFSSALPSRVPVTEFTGCPKQPPRFALASMPTTSQPLVVEGSIGHPPPPPPPPLMSPGSCSSSVARLPYYPQHASYATGIPENLSPPPALSLGLKYGLTLGSPVTPHRLVRPTPLGFGGGGSVTCYSEKDDDAYSTSSGSSSLSSGSSSSSTLSPQRHERMTSSQTDIRHGYSTSTPSPLTSPSSHGQLSPVSPGITSLEMVNGGYGFKNPILAQPSAPAPHSERPATHSVVLPAKDTGDYKCQVCDKRFRIQRLLTRHLKCHSEVKRFLCSICRKGFNDTFDLKRHTRTHTGVKPFRCQCGKAFTQRCSLESHERKVHGYTVPFAYKERRAKLYVCEDCGNTSHDPALHFLHIQTRHPHSPVLLKFYDKRQFKFSETSSAGSRVLCAAPVGSSAPASSSF